MKGLEEAGRIYSGQWLAAALRVRAIHSRLAWNTIYSVSLSGPGCMDRPEQWRPPPREAGANAHSQERHRGVRGGGGVGISPRFTSILHF